MSENLNEVEKLEIRPFTKFCMSIGAVPSSYLAGLSVEEQLLWLCSYLENEVIPTVNNNGESVEELQELFTELQTYVNNYFTNLDVQDEINNKLDEMAENGDLEDIIAAYLNTRAVLGFDTVAALKLADNLSNGTFARTLGYYTKSDGGAGLYKIRTITNDDVIDNASIISLDIDNLIAELVIEDGIINVNKFGAKGDGTTDDSSAIQKAIDYSGVHGYNNVILINQNYKCSNTIQVTYADFKIYGTPSCEYTSALLFDDEVTIGIDVKNYGFRLDNLVIKGTNLDSASTSLIGVRLVRPTGGGTSQEIENAMNIDADITNCTFLHLHLGILAKGRNVNVLTCTFGECENGFELAYLGSGHSHRDIVISDCRFHNIGANKRSTSADFESGIAIKFPDTWVRADIYGNIIRNNFFDYCNNVFVGCILGCTISDNNILDCLHDAIVAINPEDTTITSVNEISVMISNNNINIRGAESRYGIYIKGASRPRITGNVIANQPTICLYLEKCSTLWITDNVLFSNRSDITENLKIVGASGDEVFVAGNMLTSFQNANNTFANISGVSKVYTGINVNTGSGTQIVSNVTPLKLGDDNHMW